MKLALHRSITFWSGILVMAFIVWAWRDSFSRSSSVQYCANPNLYTMLHLEGEVFLLHWNNIPARSVPPGWIFDTTPVAADYSKAFLQSWWNRSDSGSLRRFALPDAAVLSGFLICWTALLLWRARRRKRALEKNPELAPS